MWGDEPIVAAVDGEAMMLTQRIQFRIAPSALRIVLPADAELNRRARRRSATVRIGTLGRVAAGRDSTRPPRR